MSITTVITTAIGVSDTIINIAALAGNQRPCY